MVIGTLSSYFIWETVWKSEFFFPSVVMARTWLPRAANDDRSTPGLSLCLNARAHKLAIAGGRRRRWS